MTNNSIILSLVVGLLSGLGTVTTPVQAAEYGIINPRTGSGVTTWDCVWFGSYWQNDTNGDGKADKNDSKQPIKWRVLSVNGDDAFLLADQCLDCQPYNTENTDVTWETCTLRTWLNQDFYSAAFSSAEQSVVKTTAVVNEDSPYYDTEGGNNTADKVYLLSFSEVKNSAYGFSDGSFDEARYGKSTGYAENHGAWVSTSTDYEGNSWWWLRSPGSFSDYAAYVGESGYVSDIGYQVDYDGDYVDSNHCGVRPALHLNLSSSQWSYAGTVSADGTVSETGAQNNSSASTTTTTNSTTASTVSKKSAVKKPAKVKSIKVTNKKNGKTVVSFKKVSGAKGYQIQYAKNKKFTKGKKSKTTKKTKYTIKKLTKKKTYYFRIRAFKLVNGTKKYGKWSAVKKLKIKK